MPLSNSLEDDHEDDSEEPSTQPQITSDARFGDAGIGTVLLLVVGLGLTLGMGALFVDALLDLRAYPSTPTPRTVAELTALTAVPRGTWVQLKNVKLDCRHGLRTGQSGKNVSAIATDAADTSTTPARVVVVWEELPRQSCEELSRSPLIGGVSLVSRMHPTGPQWPDIDWQKWPAPGVIQVWTYTGPGNSRTLLWLAPLLMLPGVLMLLGVWVQLRDAWRQKRQLRERRSQHFQVRFQMPLSTGASALQSFGLPAGVLQLLAFGPLLVASKLPDWTVVPVGLLGAAWFFTMCAAVADGWKQRASDVLLGDDRVVIRGGPANGIWHFFADLDPQRCGVSELNTSSTSTSPQGAGTALVLQGEVVALSHDAEEDQSLRAIADTLKSAATAAHRTALQLSEVSVVTCRTCHAPLAPTQKSEDSVCEHCGTPIALPASVATQLLAQDTLVRARARTEPLLRKLLRQPGARVTTLLFAVAMPALLLGFPLSMIVFDEFYQTQKVLHAGHALNLLVLALCLTYGLSFLLRAQVLGRSALRLVATQFGARPPLQAGMSCRCRLCDAPLQLPTEQSPTAHNDPQLMTLCAYCGAENLLLVQVAQQLGPQAAMAHAQVGSLQTVLQERLAVRRRLRGMSLLAVVMLAVSGYNVWRTWQALHGR